MLLIISQYGIHIYQLKTQTNLRKVFDDVTRNDSCTCEISFRERESYLRISCKTNIAAEKFPILPGNFVNWFPLQHLSNFINLPSQKRIKLLLSFIRTK